MSEQLSQSDSDALLFEEAHQRAERVIAQLDELRHQAGERAEQIAREKKQIW